MQEFHVLPLSADIMTQDKLTFIEREDSALLNDIDYTTPHTKFNMFHWEWLEKKMDIPVRSGGKKFEASVYFAQCIKKSQHTRKTPVYSVWRFNQIWDKLDNGTN